MPSAHAPREQTMPAKNEPTLIITDRATLAALERRGLALASLFGADSMDNATLAVAANFAPLIHELESELRTAAARDPLAGVDVARHSHRLFDRRFLRLPEARFALAGIVNRPDRAPFAPGSCGETRLIYRLEYALGAAQASKLPFTLGVELTSPGGAGGCAEAMRRWLEPPANDPEARASWLRSERGPLSTKLVNVASPTTRVVVNLQLVRWPSTVRPDLGGHAEYLLRAFRPDRRGALAPEPLENTPDPTALRASSARREMVNWLEHNASDVDGGTALVPTRYLATRAVSVTPRGLSRLANRPFSSFFREREFKSFPFDRAAIAKSAAGLLRRLDQLSCQGCHAARSIAGFHFLGEDVNGSTPENALAVAVSPHVRAELPRRRAIAEQMLAGEPPDFLAHFAERGVTSGSYGDACGLTRDATFASWVCAPGLACSSIEAGEAGLVGQCLPSEPEVGDACERGSIRPHPNARRDGIGAVLLTSCLDMVCNRSSVGFPGGMCTASCGSPGASCGAIAVLDSFNACLARGDSFLACIRANTRPAGLRACDAEAPCRDDYVCARGSSGSTTGVCLPPYFVFQLRVDGHSSALR